MVRGHGRHPGSAGSAGEDPAAGTGAPQAARRRAPADLRDGGGHEQRVRQQAILEYHGDVLANVPPDPAPANRMVLHPEDQQRLWDAGQRALPQGTPLEVEARVLGKDGTYRWFLIRMNPLKDDEGRVIRWYGTRTDIDDRKK